MADSSIFRRRRDIFLSHLGSYAAIIPAAELVTHHADCEYPFRQNSDFWYLTGFDEPDSVALFLPYRPEGEQYILFVMPIPHKLWEYLYLIVSYYFVCFAYPP